jgi:hypothetical protein
MPVQLPRPASTEKHTRMANEAATTPNTHAACLQPYRAESHAATAGATDNSVRPKYQAMGAITSCGVSGPGGG